MVNEVQKMLGILKTSLADKKKLHMKCLNLKITIIHQAAPTNFSNSSGLSVLRRVLPFNFLFTGSLLLLSCLFGFGLCTVQFLLHGSLRRLLPSLHGTLATAHGYKNVGRLTCTSIRGTAFFAGLERSGFSFEKSSSESSSSVFVG